MRRLLNLGCGGTRPQDPMWVNVDSLHCQLSPGSPASNALYAETNYVEADITKPLPFDKLNFDGILLSHVLEHFDAQEGLALLRQCWDMLKPGGILLVSVPDATYFRAVYHQDRNENWPLLFGVTDPKNPIPTWHEAALWFDQHKAILNEDSLWSYLVRTGFKREQIGRINSNYAMAKGASGDGTTLSHLCSQLNRLEFSLIMDATKPY